MRQSGKPVRDVTLPPWCMNDPRLFILIHRQALESAYVTQHLASWIDLVFGFKQTGKAAVDAINVFHPAVSVQLRVLFVVLFISTITETLLSWLQADIHMYVWSHHVSYPCFLQSSTEM